MYNHQYIAGSMFRF